MLLFPMQHSNIPQGPCEFAAEPWSTIVHKLGTTDTLPMIQILFKFLFCWWGSWEPVRSPRWFVIIQEFECMSAHSAIPDLFLPPSWLIAFIANHRFPSLRSVCSAIPSPPKHTSTRTCMCTLECSVPWFKWFEVPCLCLSRNCPCFESQLPNFTS